jgi:predicted CXXCH cytochrome family protein
VEIRRSDAEHRKNSGVQSTRFQTSCGLQLSGFKFHAASRPPHSHQVFARDLLETSPHSPRSEVQTRFARNLNPQILKTIVAGILRRLIRRPALAAAAGLASLFLLLSCSSFTGTVVAPPEIPGAHYVGNKSCLDCHGDYVRKFPSSPHARIHLPDAGARGQGGCESCHGPGSLHVQAGGGRGKFIVNPGKDPSACFQCHLETHAEFNLPQHHPVIEGRMNCAQCHDPHGGDILKPAGGLAMARLNETCAQCHREQTRPFVFEHEAMREGCTVCHNPHGSINRKLLAQADSNLCLRCHAQRTGPGVPAGELFIGATPHATFLKMGTCWSAGCHPAVHGSNIHPRWLF